MDNATTVIRATRPALLAGGAALLVLGAVVFSGTVHARDNISFSVGIGVPGVVVAVGNAYPVYSQPVYAQPVYAQPVYVQPRTVYGRPGSVYVQPHQVYLQEPYGYVQPAPVYIQPAPGYYQNPPGHHGRAHGRRHHGGEYYVQTPRPVYGPAFSGQRHAPVYYQR